MRLRPGHITVVLLVNLLIAAKCWLASDFDRLLVSARMPLSRFVGTYGAILEAPPDVTLTAVPDASVLLAPYAKMSDLYRVEVWALPLPAAVEFREVLPSFADSAAFALPRSRWERTRFSMAGVYADISILALLLWLIRLLAGAWVAWGARLRGRSLRRRAERCAGCGYALTGLPAPGRCPECGEWHFG